jgi:CRP-like cAMP-binding protein
MFEIGRLREIPWLRDLSAGELVSLQRDAKRTRFGPGETVITPCSRPGSVYALESGLVRLYRVAPTGGETSFGYVAPGEFFGELATFEGFAHEGFAQAMQDSVVWSLDREAFERLVTERPALLFVIARQIGQRLRQAEARVEDLVFQPVRVRVERALRELAQRFGRRDGARVVIDVPLTQAELAKLVGATRQTVNQSLGELAEAGVIGREGHRLVLLAPAEVPQDLPASASSASR